MESSGQQLLSAREVDTKVHRLACQILENHPRDPLVLVGIHRRGVPLARRLAKFMESDRPDVRVGTLDITLYRDDPENVEVTTELTSSEIPFDLSGSVVVLVDDVLYTGRTIRAAMDALIDFGPLPKSNSPASLTAATANSPSSPTTAASCATPLPANTSACSSAKKTARTGCSSSRARTIPSPALTHEAAQRPPRYRKPQQ